MNINFSKKGFTLIELLIVMAIIGILISLMTVGLGVARKTSRDTQRKSDLEIIRQGLELYKTDCDKYPLVIIPGGELAGATPPPTCKSTNKYISNIPQDPLTTRRYWYRQFTDTTYELCAALEQGSGSAGCTGACGTGMSCNYKVTSP